jgi:hypothetical protein
VFTELSGGALNPSTALSRLGYLKLNLPPSRLRYFSLRFFSPSDLKKNFSGAETRLVCVLRIGHQINQKDRIRHLESDKFRPLTESLSL